MHTLYSAFADTHRKAVLQMTRLERMKQGLIYDTCDPEIMELQRPYQEKLWAFNQLRPTDAAEVVSRDVPENVLAVGNLCHVEREIGESDREFFFRRNERIDRENLAAICEAKSKHPKFQ